MSYAAEHARALDLVKRKGAAVTFSRVTQGDYDPLAGTSTPATSTIAGRGVGVRASSPSDQQLYAGLGLKETEAPRILFVPTTHGAEVKVGDTATWAGRTRTARHVDHLRPDGTIILSKVVLA